MSKEVKKKLGLNNQISSIFNTSSNSDSGGGDGGGIVEDTVKRSCWRYCEGGESRRKDDDMFYCFRHFLRFGKICGVVPFDGIFTGGLDQVKLRLFSPGALYSVSIMLLLLINMVIGFLGLCRFGGKNATEWAWSAESFFFYSMGFFIHTHFILHGNKLITIFKTWSTLPQDFVRVDNHLSRDANLITGLIFTSAILENALLQCIFFTMRDEGSENHPALRKYYEKAQNYWSNFIPYHEFWAILIFFCNKFALYAWNFVDILIILMSRGIYHKFQSLNDVGQQVLLEGGAPSCAHYQLATLWQKFVKEHTVLCNVLKSFEEFLSPLIMASYAINCFYICLQLHLGMTASDLNNRNTTAQKVYAMWSFIHLIVRMFLVSLNAAKIHEHARNTLDILHLCPEQYETKEIERSRWKIASSRTGLTGLGCFTITRPFILKVVSVIFTIEIVLLQAPGPGYCSNNPVGGSGGNESSLVRVFGRSR